MEILVLLFTPLPAMSQSSAQRQAEKWYGETGFARVDERHPKGHCSVGFLDHNGLFNWTGYGKTWDEAFEDAVSNGFDAPYRPIGYKAAKFYKNQLKRAKLWPPRRREGDNFDYEMPLWIPNEVKIYR